MESHELQPVQTSLSIGSSSNGVHSVGGSGDAGSGDGSSGTNGGNGSRGIAMRRTATADTSNSSFTGEQNSITPLFPKIAFPSEAALQRRTSSATHSSFGNSQSNVDDFSSWLNYERAKDKRREISGYNRRSSSVGGPGGSITPWSSTGMLLSSGGNNNNSESNVYSVVDDAASSVCIDDDDDGTEMRQAMVEVLRNSAARRKNNLISNDDSTPLEPISEFDEYTQRVAREMVIRERAERKMRSAKDSRQYGNYFSSPNPDDIGTYYTPSHDFDNFNGRRQNIVYNHQLNELNSPYTYEERQRRRLERFRQRHHHSHHDPTIPENLVEEMPDEVSMITLDIDDLQSGDDDDDLLSFHSYHNRDEDGGGANRVPRLKRKLLSRHVQLLALGGTLGVGSFFNSSQSFFRSGPFGTLLGYLITGLMVLSSMLSLGEMVALLPSDKGITSFASRFVDDSLGFALGIVYWFSCVMALPSEVTGAAMMISNYPMLDSSDNSILVWITFFLVIVLLVNLFDVGILGELQSLASLAIFISLILLMIFMSAANNGQAGPYQERVGFRYWDYSKSNFTTHQIYGLFRPNYALDIVVDSPTEVTIVKSIGGNLGRFLQLWSAISQSAFSYIGTELVFTTAGEVRNPRKSIPAATKKIFWRILICFCLGIFIVGINVYSGDPRLMKLGPDSLKLYGSDYLNAKRNSPANATVNPIDITAIPPEQIYRCDTIFWSFAGFSGPTSSPWIIALQAIGSCGVAASANALFIVCALSSGISHLYAASRTLYGLSVQGKIWFRFKRCSNAGVPYISVLFSFIFALLAYMCSTVSSSRAFEWLVTLCTSAGLLVWAGTCLSFIRFYQGLKLRRDIMNRDDEVYPFKSPLQPYTAYFGLVSSSVLVIFLGFELFLTNQWNTGQFFATYSAIFVFVVCFAVHKIIYKTRLIPLNNVDLDSGRKEVENIAWAEDRVYSRGFQDWIWIAWSKLKLLINMIRRHDKIAED